MATNDTGQQTMVNHAMSFGMVVGVYYIVKFCLFPLSLHSTMAAFLFLGLTMVVPFLVFRLVKLYRDRYCGGLITFPHAMVFAALIMGFGSLLASVAHYAYFAFIDDGAMVGALVQSVELLQDIDPTALEGADTGAEEQLGLYVETMQQTVRLLQAMSPIDITIGMLSNNFSWSIVLALPVALFVKKKNPTNP